MTKCILDVLKVYIWQWVYIVETNQLFAASRSLEATKHIYNWPDEKFLAPRANKRWKWMNVVKCCDFFIIMWFCVYYCIIIAIFVTWFRKWDMFFGDKHSMWGVFFSFATFGAWLFDMSRGFSLSCTSDDMATTWPENAFLDVNRVNDEITCVSPGARLRPSDWSHVCVFFWIQIY